LAQAAEALGESVRLKSDYAPGYLFQAKALLRLGRLPEAEEAARAGVGCRPEEWEGYLVLADVLAATGRKAEAITAAEQAVKLAHPNEPRPKQALEALKKQAVGVDRQRMSVTAFCCGRARGILPGFLRLVPQEREP